MALPQITWQDVQQAPDDGKRREAVGGEIHSPATEDRDRGIKRELYERQGVREYWIVDPEEDAVEVWSFGGKKTGQARFTDRLPVRLRGDVLGEIDLAEVFRRG